MRTDSGGRVALEMASRSETEVSYDLELRSPEGVWSGRVTVAERDGEVTFAPFAPAGEPAWLVALTKAFLRGAWRDHQGGEPWPDRIHRWRAETAAR